MASITNEQISKINNMCSNGWKLDVDYFIFHNEKTLIKQISLDEENYLEFTIRYNYKNQISLHISKFYQEKGKNYASTSGMGKSKVLRETQYRTKRLCNLIVHTAILSDARLLEINKNTELASGYGLIIQSEEF